MRKKISKNLIFYLVIVLIAIIIRVRYLNYISGDYVNFLKPWIEQIRELNGINALKENIGNYNVPYILILTLISYLKCEPLIPIKIVSIIFDFVCAIVVYNIIYKITNDKNKSLIGSVVIMFLPTVILNGAMWGQCDSIYCSFVLLSIYFLLDKRYIRSFIMLGIAFAFKLQTIFILPLFVLMLFREKGIKWYYFFIIPLVNFILCLPAIIAGRSIVDVLTIYFNQTNYYSDLTCNFPNIYAIIQDFEFATTYSNIITLIGIAITLLIFFTIWLMVLIKKVEFDYENIITFGMWSVIISTFFLPRMHDRYMFIADILSVIWYIAYGKKILLPITINLVSLYTYIIYLSGGAPAKMFMEVIIAIIIIDAICTFLYIMFLNKKLKPIIILVNIFIVCVLTSGRSYTYEICAILYMAVIIYFAIYMTKRLFNKKVCKCEICEKCEDN